MCVWGGCIGEDPFGDFLLQTLEESGVQTTGVITDGAHGSYVMGDGYAFVVMPIPLPFAVVRVPGTLLLQASLLDISTGRSYVAACAAPQLRPASFARRSSPLHGKSHPSHP